MSPSSRRSPPRRSGHHGDRLTCRTSLSSMPIDDPPWPWRSARAERTEKGSTEHTTIRIGKTPVKEWNSHPGSSGVLLADKGAEALPVARVTQRDLAGFAQPRGLTCTMSIRGVLLDFSGTLFRLELTSTGWSTTRQAARRGGAGRGHAAADGSGRSAGWPA